MSYPLFTKIWRQLKLYAAAENYSGTFRVPKQKKPSVDAETPVGGDFSTIEYAVERKILETPVLELSYYADVVGFVPPVPLQPDGVRLDPVDVGNGDTAPEWGVDLVVRGGFVKYGPWADRQRYSDFPT